MIAQAAVISVRHVGIVDVHRHAVATVRVVPRIPLGRDVDLQHGHIPPIRRGGARRGSPRCRVRIRGGEVVRAWILCSIVGMCLLSHGAWAQDAPPSAPLQMGLPSLPPLMRVPSPLPPGGAREIPLPAPRRDLFRADPQTFSPAFDQLPAFDPRFFPCCGSFVGPVFAPVKPRWARSSIHRIPQAGYLRLLVQPETAQVHVDGFYMGTVFDVQRLVALEPAPYRIELRAAGYETVTFDVRIVPNETITYRTDLQRSVPAGQPLAAAPVPKTFYVIPGCYAGDRPPERTTLPRNCNVARLRTIPPTLTDVRQTPPAPRKSQ